MVGRWIKWVKKSDDFGEVKLRVFFAFIIEYWFMEIDQYWNSQNNILRNKKKTTKRKLVQQRRLCQYFFNNSAT